MYLSNDTSGDSGTRAQAESSITINIVERESAYFVHLCRNQLH